MAAPGFGLKEPFPGFPPPLTTRPEGLLSMLGIQTNGRYPQHLEMETLSPGIDLLNWYMESRAEITGPQDANMSTAVVGGFLPLLTVPTNQVWILLAATLAPSAIVTGCTVQLARARANDSRSRLALGAPVAMTPTSLPMAYSEDSVRYLVFRPSVQIGYVYVAGGSGTGNTFDFTLRFVRCQI
jgi:hypothetical protein